jgi:hypothetical protein
MQNKIADVIDNKELPLTMDYAAVEYSMADAVFAFTRGTDKSGKERFLDKEGIPQYGFYKQDGSFDEQKLQHYIYDLQFRSLNRLPEEEREALLQTDEGKNKLRHIMEEIFAKDIMGNFTTLTFNLVNSRGKADKKAQLLYDAFAQKDPAAILHCGEAFTRMIGEMSNAKKIQVLQQLKGLYDQDTNFQEYASTSELSSNTLDVNKQQKLDQLRADLKRLSNTDIPPKV